MTTIKNASYQFDNIIVMCLRKEIEMNCSEKHQLIDLKKKYSGFYGVPVIASVESSIFAIHYYTHCLSSGFCNDICCSSGADIDIDNVGRIMMYAEQIENYLKIPRTEWFIDSYKYDKEFPGGQYSRTKVRDNTCVFINKNERGCMIHKFCMLNNIDFHILKPMVGSLFPITFNEGVLHPSNEVLDNSLICLHKGPTLYQGVREELIYYFGLELVNELDSLENEIGRT
jgi:hypothetical protein